MRYGLQHPERLLRALNWNWIGLPIIAAYLYSMFIYPWTDGEWSWCHVHSVWHYWQSLNVGMLAFTSSVIVFNAAQNSERKRREREHVAARAFLCDALAELSLYLKSYAAVVREAWQKSESGREDRALASSKPELPGKYREIFSSCIATAEAGVGDYLADILIRLQIGHSRLLGLYDQFADPDSLVLRANVKVYMFRLAELKAIINNTYSYARNMAELKPVNLIWEDYLTAFGNLEIEYRDYEDLEEFTKRTIKRGGAGWDT